MDQASEMADLNDSATKPQQTTGKSKTKLLAAANKVRRLERVLSSLENSKNTETSTPDAFGNVHPVAVAWFVVLPNKWTTAWEAFICALIVYVVIVVPYRIAFIPEWVGWLASDLIIDFCFLLDIILSFFLAKRRPDFASHHLITDPREIAINYLRTYFIIDAIATLPFYLILPYPNSINRLIRIVRINRVLSLIKLIRKPSMMAMPIIGRIVLSIQLNSAIERLLWFCFWFILVLHISACLWIYVGFAYITTYPQTWLTAFGYVGTDPSVIYVAALYFVIFIVATVGLGDIHPVNFAEQVFTIFLMIGGVSLFTFVIGTISSIFNNLDKQSNAKRKKLDVVNSYVEYFELPPSLRKRVIRHFEDTSDVSIFAQNLLTELPSNLRAEVTMHINKEIISKIPFLQGQDLHFVSAVINSMSMLTVEANELIVQAGTRADEMYFLIDGQIDLIVAGKKVKTLDSGSMFGEFALFNQRHPVSVQSVTDCSLYFISRKRLQEIADDFPELHQHLRKSSKAMTRLIEDSGIKIDDQAAVGPSNVGIASTELLAAIESMRVEMKVLQAHYAEMKRTMNQT